MLQQHHVAGCERREPGAEGLPEGEVPRHHCQHDAERLIPDVALGRGALDRLVGEEPGGIVPDPACGPGALLDLTFRLDDGLAHLGREDRCITRFVRPQHARHVFEQARAVLDACIAPAEANVPGSGDRGLDRSLIGLVESRQLAATGRVDRLQHSVRVARLRLWLRESRPAHCRRRS